MSYQGKMIWYVYKQNSQADREMGVAIKMATCADEDVAIRLAERMEGRFWRVFVVDADGEVIWDSQAGAANDNVRLDKK